MSPVDHLHTLLKGQPAGYSRDELASRLKLPDRAVRDLIADAIITHGIPIVSPGAGGGRYRLARRDEIHVINDEVRELRAREASVRRRWQNLERAWLDYHAAGSLFLAPEGAP
jgi:hypothetical protein